MMAMGGAVKLVLTNGSYKGNVYDGSGYWGSRPTTWKSRWARARA